MEGLIGTPMKNSMQIFFVYGNKSSFSLTLGKCVLMAVPNQTLHVLHSD